MKRVLLTMAGVLLTVSLVSAGTTVPVLAEEETTLVYWKRRLYQDQSCYG